MKSFTISLLFALMYTFSSAGENWTTYYKNNLIHISSTKTACNDVANGTYREYVLLKIENLSDKKVVVNYKKDLWYNDQCTTCEKPGNEYELQVVLEPNQTLTGTCNTRERALSIFSKMLDMHKSELTKFELNNVEVNIIR